MDWNRVEGNWKQVKGKVKEKWVRRCCLDFFQQSFRPYRPPFE
jgi:hypothetical protein